jgi:hypothetical protein
MRDNITLSKNGPTNFDVVVREDMHTVYYTGYKEEGLLLNISGIGQYHGIILDLSNDRKKSLSVYLMV